MADITQVKTWKQRAYVIKTGDVIRIVKKVFGYEPGKILKVESLTIQKTSEGKCLHIHFEGEDKQGHCTSHADRGIMGSLEILRSDLEKAIAEAIETFGGKE